MVKTIMQYLKEKLTPFEFNDLVNHIESKEKESIKEERTKLKEAFVKYQEGVITEEEVKYFFNKED